MNYIYAIVKCVNKHCGEYGVEKQIGLVPVGLKVYLWGQPFCGDCHFSMNVFKQPFDDSTTT